MSYLVDTNILLRSAQPSYPMHADAARAVGELLARGKILSIIPQNIIEYCAVTTRPIEANGLGMSVDETAAEVVRLQSIFSEWKRLVSKNEVKGKEVYDARIVAVMLAHRVTRLLTFNTADFKLYTEITAINPREV